MASRYRRTRIVVVAVAALALSAAGCQPESGGTGAGAESATTPPPAEPVAEMEGSEAAFFVSLPDGTKLTVGVFENREWMGKRLKFDTPVRKTDFNVYVISRASLVEVYGTERGLFSQSDMSVSFRSELGNVITATLTGGHKLGIYPLLDKAGKMMTGIYLWVE